MSVASFVPAVWNAQLLLQLEKNIIFSQPSVCNRNYEGDIADFGDTVHINRLTRPTISPYTKNSTVVTPQVLTTTDNTLVINQAQYFAFGVDDVDARQARDGGALLNDAAVTSAEGVAEVIDNYIATLMSTGAGTILTPGAVSTPDAAYLQLLKMKVALDRNSVPQMGRFFVVSPEFYALILHNPQFIDVARYGSSDPIQNGEVGKIVGASILVSANAPVGTSATLPAVSSFIYAGHPMATTFASQISKTEAYRPPSSFEDAIKGLQLYGAQIVRPEALVVMDTDVTVA